MLRPAGIKKYHKKTMERFTIALTKIQLDLLSDILHSYKNRIRNCTDSLYDVMDMENDLTTFTRGRYEADTTYDVKTHMDDECRDIIRRAVDRQNISREEFLTEVLDMDCDTPEGQTELIIRWLDGKEKTAPTRTGITKLFQTFDFNGLCLDDYGRIRKISRK